MTDEHPILDGDTITPERVGSLPWIHRPSTYRFDPKAWEGTSNGPILMVLANMKHSDETQ